MVTYQVGSLLLPGANDPEIDDYQEAVRLAISKSSEGTTVVGVWTGQEQGSELLAVAYEGELFRK